MKKQHHFQDEGLVLKKKKLKDYNQVVTILSKHHGKLSLIAFGTKKLTSRRLSHLETGNVVAFSWRVQDDFATLGETELKYAHSKIKEDEEKIHTMYVIFFVLNRLVPMDHPEEDVYNSALSFLRELHLEKVTQKETDQFLTEILQILGFVTVDQLEDASFDPITFIEGLIGRKIMV